MSNQDRAEVKAYEAIDACFTDTSEAGSLIRNFFRRNVLAGTIVGKPSSDRDLIYGKALVNGRGEAFGLAMYLSDGIPAQIFFSKNFDVVNPATSDYTVNITRIESKLSAETSGNPLHLNEPFDSWVVSRLTSLSDVIRAYNATAQPSIA